MLYAPVGAFFSSTLQGVNGLPFCALREHFDKKARRCRLAFQVLILTVRELLFLPPESEEEYHYQRDHEREHYCQRARHIQVDGVQEFAHGRQRFTHGNVGAVRVFFDRNVKRERSRIVTGKVDRDFMFAGSEGSRRRAGILSAVHVDGT